MNTLLPWLTSPEWALVVKALLHSLWQGALIATGVALLLRGISNPTARYRVSLAGLGAVFASAVITWAALNTPKPSAPNFVTAPVAGVESVPAASGPVQKIIVAANWTPSKPQTQWTAWLALAWLIGAGAMLGRASIKVAGAEQLRRACRPLNDERIAALVAEARRAVKLTRQVRVAVTEQLTSPAVVGVLVPTLILPLSLLTTLTPEQIRFVLLHELAHIRRGDYLTNLFQLFAEALLFFNPAVWWLSHQVRREREACCDALAIELSGAPADYARTLVSVAETMLTASPTAAPAFGNEREPSSLADRVQRLIVPGYRPSLRLTWRAMLTALIVGSVLLGLLAAGTRETVAATAALLEPRAVLTKTPEYISSLVAITTNSWVKPTATINPATGLPERGGTNLYTRTFNVGSNALVQAVQKYLPPGEKLGSTNNLGAISRAVQQMFASAGVDLESPGKSVFFKDRQGIILVRATLQDLDAIESLFQKLNQPAPAAQVNIRAKFVEVPEKLMTNLLFKFVLETNKVGSLSGFLTDPQARVLFRAFEQMEDVEILSAPNITTLSGRQAQIQIAEMKTLVVTGETPIITNGFEARLLQTTNMQFGPVLDVLPTVAADGFSIQMLVIPTITEFLGYHYPGSGVTAKAPLPHVRVRQIPTSAPTIVFDGQTIVIDGFVSEHVWHTLGGAVSRQAAPGLDKKHLLLFVTPTIVDRAGNRVHTDEEIYDRYNGPKPLPGKKAIQR